MVSSSSGALADLAFMEAQMGMASVETMVASAEAEASISRFSCWWNVALPAPSAASSSVFVPVASAGYIVSRSADDLD